LSKKSQGKITGKYFLYYLCRHILLLCIVIQQYSIL